MADSSIPSSESLQVAARSDVGMRRANNQDSQAVVLASDSESWQQRGHVFVVADGMGAHAAGELASKLAVDNVPHTYNKVVDLPAPKALEKAIIDANQLIHTRGSGSVDFQGMGTTCSVLVLLPAGALVGHVGDSRVYRLRNQTLEQLTFDHSLVWEMEAAGTLSAAGGAQVVPKNVITRSLGPNAEVRVDLEGPLPVEPGDVYLVCSDGLTGPVEDEEIGVILDCLPADEAVQTLVDLANLRGGPDNITAILVRVGGPLEMSGSGIDFERSAPAVHPALWTLIGVCLAMTGLMTVFNKGVPAALCLVGALVAGGMAAFQKYGFGILRRSQRFNAPLGKGPYRSYPSSASEPFVRRLAETVEKLAQAARDDRWPLDWEHFASFREQAVAAGTRGDQRAAVVHYTQAIRFLIAQLRANRAL